MVYDKSPSMTFSLKRKGKGKRLRASSDARKMGVWKNVRLPERKIMQVLRRK